MIRDNFKKWLIEEARYSEKSARDVLSRCRRVERIFNIDIDNALKSEKGFKQICERLWDEAGSYIKPGATKTTSVSIITTAVKLYHKFTNS